MNLDLITKLFYQLKNLNFIQKSVKFGQESFLLINQTLHLK